MHQQKTGGQGSGRDLADSFGLINPNNYTGQIVSPNQQYNYPMNQYDPNQDMRDMILKHMYPQDYKTNT